VAYEQVPLFIEGGQALHSGNSLRRWLHVSLQGQEGVLEPGDCVVKQLATPGPKVRIMPGAFAIRARSASAFREMYFDSITAEEQLDVTATTSSGPRSDLVVIRVESPYAPGETWPVPGDPVNGPYIRPRIIQGVPSTCKTLLQAGRGNDTALVLGRLDISASTATMQTPAVTFVDLRTVVGTSDRNESDTNNDVTQQIWSDSKHCNGGDVIRKSNTTFINWPVQATWQVPIPSWASGMDLMGVEIINPLIENDTLTVGQAANAFGDAQLTLTTSNGGAISMIPTVFDMNGTFSATSGGYRQSIKIGGTVYLPPEVRGRTATVKFQCRSSTDPRVSARMTATSGTYANFMVIFKRNPDFSS
jgi:hypothetical protein